MATTSKSSSQATSLAATGCALLALAAWGLCAEVVWISQAFYIYVWWGWILLLDGFCVWRRQSSLLTTRRRLIPLLATSSVTFWFCFEALNLRFRNWYYVGSFELDSYASLLASGVFVFAAFSTVFIGMFEAFEALGAARILTRRGEPRKLPSWLPRTLQLLGLAMALLAIAFPFYLAPLVWGSLTFLLDPWNYRRGNRSLLRDIEAGDWRAVARLFVAGLICGFVWESLNYLAPQKWIYTVRGLEDFKLFEMPLLGFLGFPALAFDAVTAFSMISALACGNLSWEHPDDLVARPLARDKPNQRLFWRSLPLQVAFWVVVTAALMPRSIGSIRLRLERIPSLQSSMEILKRHNIRWPRQLQRALADPEERRELQNAMTLSAAELRRVEDELDLYLFKGIGASYGRLLQSAGVERIEDLTEWTPVTLHDELKSVGEEEALSPPPLDWVRVWVLASR
ncbi:MAG: hypothetical protein ACI8X5_003478 [Planctomycetota bacterium]